MKTMKAMRIARRGDWILVLLCVCLALSAYLFWRTQQAGALLAPPPLNAPDAKAGDMLGIDETKTYNPAEATAIIKRNYGETVPASTTPITKLTFHYRSKTLHGEWISIHGRAYLPGDPAKNLPVFAFAPGTTGIGDKCAASLEQPLKSNWADYDSHLAAYAAQGFAVVTTDYEGMRDTSRIHHYMVGELEGRALLDSVRALRRLPAARGRLSPGDVFLSGYSQGGHAAFWADKIAATYAPDVRSKGIIGFGPVMSVKQTLADVSHGANINWFGPYVLYSYRDYYQADYAGVLLPRWDDVLATDVPAHCIDTDLPFWGYTPHGVYTPEFIQAMSTGQYGEQFARLSADFDRNEVGSVATPSAKRINQGQLDNVVLPAQQTAALPALCHSSRGPVDLMLYPNSTHYNTMLHSFHDTINWMRQLVKGEKVASTCTPAPSPTPSP